MKRLRCIRQILQTGALAIAAGWTAGCESTRVAYRPPTMDAWTATAPKTASAAAKPKPPAARAAPAPQPATTTVRVEDRKLPTTRIGDLNLSGPTEVSTVLRILARAAGVNMLISPKVSGTVSLTLKDVPWDEAFRSVLASAGLNHTWDGNVLRVMTAEDMRVELEMETILQERESVRVAMRATERMAVEVIKIRYAKAANIGAAIRTLFVRTAAATATPNEPATPQAQVTVDEENNSVVIHATRDDIDKAAELASRLDRPKPQVLIEAKIVEASQDTARQLGVQWGGHRAGIVGQRMLNAGGAEVTAGGYVSDFSAPFAQELARPYGFALGFVSQAFGGGETLNMQLTALARDGLINILSSPSVTTLDNEKAIIESGEERAYRKTTGTGNILDVSLEWKKAVLKLEVTPHVIDDRRLKVEIVANKDSFDETKPQTNGEYPVNTKSAQTTVILMDGETAVIGGLARESRSESNTGIPLLKDIPWVGALFRNEGRAASKDDTMIFITPRILHIEE